MEWNPSELVEYQHVEDGDYLYTVVEANETVSSKGNPMINLKLQFDVGQEKPISVFHSLVSVPKSLGFVKEFCERVSPPIDFESGLLDAQNCIGRTGIAHLKFGAENDKGRRYLEVQYFVAPKDDGEDVPAEKIQPPSDSTPAEADDIPF